MFDVRLCHEILKKIHGAKLCYETLCPHLLVSALKYVCPKSQLATHWIRNQVSGIPEKNIFRYLAIARTVHSDVRMDTEVVITRFFKGAL